MNFPRDASEVDQSGQVVGDAFVRPHSEDIEFQPRMEALELIRPFQDKRIEGEGSGDRDIPLEILFWNGVLGGMSAGAGQRQETENQGKDRRF